MPIAQEIVEQAKQLSVEDRRYVLRALEASLAADTTTGTSPEDAWDVLGRLVGIGEGPMDWASEHDHYLYPNF